MTMLYPIVLETEEDGAVSAYVPGLPVYAAADTQAKAERAIRAVLKAYLVEHPSSKPDARLRVARFSDAGTGSVEIVGVEFEPLPGLKKRSRNPARCEPQETAGIFESSVDDRSQLG